MGPIKLDNRGTHSRQGVQSFWQDVLLKKIFSLLSSTMFESVNFSWWKQRLLWDVSPVRERFRVSGSLHNDIPQQRLQERCKPAHSAAHFRVTLNFLNPKPVLWKRVLRRWRICHKRVFKSYYLLMETTTTPSNWLNKSAVRVHDFHWLTSWC